MFEEITQEETIEESGTILFQALVNYEFTINTSDANVSIFEPEYDTGHEITTVYR